MNILNTLKQGFLVPYPWKPVRKKQVSKISVRVRDSGNFKKHYAFITLQSAAKALISGLTGFVLCALLFASNSSGDELQRTTLQVSNLSCPSCIGEIELELGKIGGTVGMTADLKSGTVEVDHQSTLAPEEIATAISKMGYAAQLSSTQTIEEEKAHLFSQSARVFCGMGACGSPKNCGAAGSAWKELYERFMKKAF